MSEEIYELTFKGWIMNHLDLDNNAADNLCDKLELHCYRRGLKGIPAIVLEDGVWTFRGVGAREE